MRIGIVPLAMGVAVAATRLTGAQLAADTLAYIYLAFVTLTMTRTTSLFWLQRV